MRALETIRGLRVVASPDVLDRLVWPEDVAPLRLAPDDLFVVGAVTGPIGDEPVIAVEETGFVGWWLTDDEVVEVLEHVEWPVLEQEGPALSQGLIAGVPAKFWLPHHPALLLCAAAYAHELEARLQLKDWLR